jgi:pilus assembly protein Flp/PilA
MDMARGRAPCPASIQGYKDMNMIKKLWNDESGASAAEYALILAIVGAGIAVASFDLGTAISTAMDTAGDCIDGTTAPAAC